MTRVPCPRSWPTCAPDGCPACGGTGEVEAEPCTRDGACKCAPCVVWRARGTELLAFAIALACGMAAGAWLW